MTITDFLADKKQVEFSRQIKILPAQFWICEPRFLGGAEYNSRDLGEPPVAGDPLHFKAYLREHGWQNEKADILVKYQVFDTRAKSSRCLEAYKS